MGEEEKTVEGKTTVEVPPIVFTGELKWLPIDDIKIDRKHYQRGEVSKKNTERIAFGFDPVAFAAVSVARRPGGSYWAMDGQQRLLALRRRGYHGKVPCKVDDVSQVREEALHFIQIDTYRKAVGSVPKFRAAVTAGQEPQTSIAKWLRGEGLVIGTSGHNSPNVIDFAATLVSLWEYDEQASKNALCLQMELNRGTNDFLDHRIHRGFWWLCHHGPSNGLFLKDHIKKLKSLGGKVAVVQSINRMQILSGNSVASERCAGSGVLELINKGRRNKFEIDIDHHGGKGYHLEKGPEKK